MKGSHHHHQLRFPSLMMSRAIWVSLLSVVLLGRWNGVMRVNAAQVAPTPKTSSDGPPMTIQANDPRQVIEEETFVLPLFFALPDTLLASSAVAREMCEFPLSTTATPSSPTHASPLPDSLLDAIFEDASFSGLFATTSSPLLHTPWRLAAHPFACLLVANVRIERERTWNLALLSHNLTAIDEHDHADADTRALHLDQMVQLQRAWSVAPVSTAGIASLGFDTLMLSADDLVLFSRASVTHAQVFAVTEAPKYERPKEPLQLPDCTFHRGGFLRRRVALSMNEQLASQCSGLIEAEEEIAAKDAAYLIDQEAARAAAAEQAEKDKAENPVPETSEDAALADPALFQRDLFLLMADCEQPFATYAAEVTFLGFHVTTDAATLTDQFYIPEGACVRSVRVTLGESMRPEEWTEEWPYVRSSSELALFGFQSVQLSEDDFIVYDPSQLEDLDRTSEAVDIIQRRKREAAAKAAEFDAAMVSPDPQALVGLLAGHPSTEHVVPLNGRFPSAEDFNREAAGAQEALEDFHVAQRAVQTESVPSVSFDPTSSTTAPPSMTPKFHAMRQTRRRFESLAANHLVEAHLKWTMHLMAYSCAVSAGGNPAMGNCPASLAASGTCQFSCNAGYSLTANTVCDASTGVLDSVGGCAACSPGCYWSVSRESRRQPKPGQANNPAYIDGC